MKSYFSVFVFLVCSSLFIPSLRADSSPLQDSTGLPGDNFSLEGALQLFLEAGSPEAFEQALNTEANNVNNLDLNGDGDIDYIRVVGMNEKDARVFILQVPVSEKENQDIAVLELEKNGAESAFIQIVGDEDIYGEEIIVEPGEDFEKPDSKPNKGKGPFADEAGISNTGIINVWFYPCVRYVYAPAYRPWVSPWRWKYYPSWWRPWRPVTWKVWRPRHMHYHRPFVRVHTHRTVHAHAVYVPKRTTSVSVKTRHSASVGRYRVNHSKTRVTGPRGNTATMKKTTIKGPKGKVKVSKTKMRRKKG